MREIVVTKGEGFNVNKHIKITITSNKLSYFHDATFVIHAAVKSERKQQQYNQVLQVISEKYIQQEINCER